MDDDPRLGLLAFGDSITNGGGELQWGVALQSWAQWTARALGLALTNFAVDGARVAVQSVVTGQARSHQQRHRHLADIHLCAERLDVGQGALAYP